MIALAIAIGVAPVSAGINWFEVNASLGAAAVGATIIGVAALWPRGVSAKPVPKNNVSLAKIPARTVKPTTCEISVNINGTLFVINNKPLLKKENGKIILGFPGAQVLVNAANAELAQGCGVCGEIYKLAGSMPDSEPGLEISLIGSEIASYQRMRDGMGGGLGAVVKTKAYDLNFAGVKAIYHAVAPNYNIKGQTDVHLEKIYKDILFKASKKDGYKKIASPCLSAGYFLGKRKIEDIAYISIKSIVQWLQSGSIEKHGIEDFYLNCYNDAQFEVYKNALETFIAQDAACHKGKKVRFQSNQRTLERSPQAPGANEIATTYQYSYGAWRKEVGKPEQSGQSHKDASSAKGQSPRLFVKKSVSAVTVSPWSWKRLGAAAVGGILLAASATNFGYELYHGLAS